MPVILRRAPRRHLARPLAKPTVLEICAEEMTVTQTAVYLLIAERTLRNWRARGNGPACTHLRYRMADNEQWIAEHVTGPGGRHEHFPVGRVATEQVARYLGKSIRQLEDMRCDGYGPPWLKLARVVSYWIPEVVRWASERGVLSDYAMRPVVGEVIVKPALAHPPEIEAFAEAMRGARQ